MHTKNSSDFGDRGTRIAAIVERVTSRRLAGETVSDDQVIADHHDLMPELGGELDELGRVLEARRAAAGAFDDGSSVAARTAAPMLNALPGYHVQEEIFRGGQGVVYRATQLGTRREVAIKVMREGPFAGPREQARFEREVHILGQFKHPNIVTVHDSGTAGGSAYIVMDYIPGQPLNAWADAIESRAGDRDARTREILRVFTGICTAVNVAHLRGVIHRDLKPGNIRIDPAGEPHVLDFGLAKVSRYDVLNDSSAERTLTGQFVGSLPWASPEQAAGETDIDIRTDVYSLGVILYHLLTSEFPYPMSGTAPQIIERILHDDPVSPRRLRGAIDADLETIALKCLQKDRARRYQSAGELAGDVQRYLDDEPIEARRDSRGYVLRKLLWRYRVPVGVAALFAVLVVSAAIALGVLYQQARQQEQVAREERDRAREQEQLAEQRRQEAETEARRAERVREFLQDMLAAADPWQTGTRDVSVQHTLAKAAELVGTELADEPAIEAAVRQTLGATYAGLGNLETAAAQLRTALMLHETIYGPDALATAGCLHDLGTVLAEQGDYEQAEALLDRALAVRRAKPGGVDADVAATLTSLVQVYLATGRAPLAEQTARELLEIARGLADADKHVAAALNTLAAVRKQQAAYAEAVELYRESLERTREVYGEQHPDVAISANNLATALKAIGQLDEAEALLREALPIARDALGVEHPYYAVTLNNLGDLLLDRGDHRAAEPYYREAAERIRAQLGDRHPYLATTLNNLAELLRELGEYQQAELLYREVIDILREQYGDAHPQLGTTIYNLANACKGQNRDDEAERLYREALTLLRRAHGDGHPLVAQCLHGLGDLLTFDGRYEEALACFDEGLEIVRGSLGPEHVMAAWMLSGQGRVRLLQKDFEAALPPLRYAARIARDASAPGHWMPAVMDVNLGVCLSRLGRYDEAETLLLRAHEELLRAFGAGHPKLREALEGLAEMYDAWGYPDKAAQYRARLD